MTPAMILLTPILVPFISTQHRFLYHQDGSALTVMLALFANITLVWLFFVAIFMVADRVPWFAMLFWAAFLACLPVVLLRNWGALAYRTAPSAVHRTLLAISCAFLVFVILAWRPLLLRRAPVILSRLKALTGFVSLGWMVTILQLAWYTVLTPRLDATPALHGHEVALAATQRQTVHPRIVWIVMDELGYQPAFADRFPGLTLPAFDALAAESTNFTQARSPGLSTEEVIPEIIMGRSVGQVQLTAAGAFTFRPVNGGSLERLKPYDTVFEDALHDGYSTAIAGWFNPYCRLLAPVLDRCFWTSRANSTTADFDVEASFLTNLTGPAQHVLRKGTNFVADADRREAKLHTQDLSAILKAADGMIADPTATLLFIHLPVPHPGGIYDRRRGVLSTDSRFSYVDNLALADKVLAHLHDELSKAGDWDSSAVILMGDHSWRTTMRWIPTRSWMPEDQAASRGGQFDPRPAYLVKLPDQQKAFAVDQPYDTVRTRSLLDTIMSGQVRTPTDLQHWLAQP